MDCRAFCTASSYELKSLYEFLRVFYPCTLYREVLHAEISTQEGNCDSFFFDYGTVVLWGPVREKEKELMEQIKKFEVLPLQTIETDEFTFVYGEQSKMDDDLITLPNKVALTKLAFSHGIAQSVKLGSFELTMLQSFEQVKDLPECLARKGKISLSRKAIRKKMGALFVDRNSINLHAEVLDTPEFFWEYPELELSYEVVASHLDIARRVEVLNQRLDVVHEMFQMLGSELNHQHSSRLELTIIILIVIEVILTLMKDVFRIL